MNAVAMNLPTYHVYDGERADDFIDAAARGLAALKTFGRAQQLTMAEVARACGISRAGARRILLTLEDLGYVQHTGRHFELTPRILNLADGYTPRSPWDVARPYLQRVADALNELVFAGVLEGDAVVYSMHIRSARAMHMDLSAGARLPAHLSGIGRVLLAALPPVELGAYLERVNFPRLTPHTICDRGALVLELERVQERGSCCILGEIDEALSCVAIPLRDRMDRVVAAFGVGLSANRATGELVEDRIIPALRAAAREIKILL